MPFQVMPNSIATKYEPVYILPKGCKGPIDKWQGQASEPFLPNRK